jgi:hypothetical protein
VSRRVLLAVVVALAGAACVGAAALIAAGTGDDGGRGSAATAAGARLVAPDLPECRQLGGALADQASCARATKVQNLLGKPVATFVPIVDGCSRFAVAARAPC